jgi:hypothetical protein
MASAGAGEELTEREMKGIACFDSRVIEMKKKLFCFLSFF